MKTKAVRLYGVDDIRLDEFELPEIKDDEILVKVVSDSICMSTWKTVKQGAIISVFPMMWRIIRLLSDMSLRGILCR
ncbi:hypothetical protein MKA47_05105 [[Clostridium] innocuum]|nr:hypothetical protein [[Clostridium] innocuum]